MAIDDDEGSKTKGDVFEIREPRCSVRQFGEVAVDESCFPSAQGDRGSEI
jgi:hypothetical protein